MKRRYFAAASFLLFTLTTGCSPMHGDPNHPKKNLHPMKRYEVTVTADAPGPWDSVSGTVFFDVVNLECTPEDKFLGVHAKPRDVSIDFEMKRVDEKTWKGHFYRDSMHDEDYYGLGVCHWDATSLTPSFMVHGEAFNASTLLQDALHKGPQITYFKKIEYHNHALTSNGALQSKADTPDVLKHPEAFFPISVTVQESAP